MQRRSFAHKIVKSLSVLNQATSSILKGLATKKRENYLSMYTTLVRHLLESGSLAGPERYSSKT